MGRSITSANGILAIGVKGLFNTPQQIQGFSAEDIFDSEAVQNAEIVMGMDGQLSAGWVPAPIKQKITLMANSISNTVFETLYAAEQAAKEKYWLFGTWKPGSLGVIYTLQNGVVSSFTPMSSAKKTMQPRAFEITWEAVISSPTLA